MQQRRVRLGDILDDYCPRERRITNHAVVAMIEDEVKQTRCTTCDADHEYKQAKVPPPRKKKPGGALVTGTVESPSLAPTSVVPPEDPVLDETFEAVESPAEPFMSPPEIPHAAAAAPESEPEASEDTGGVEDEWPVHRPLIRATLPRPEGQTPERKEPEFTIRQNGRFDRNGNNRRNRPGRGPGSGQNRFNQSHSGSGHRSGSGHGQGQGQGPGAGHHSGQGARHGNRPPSGQRGRSGGQGRGPNSGQGRGRRGR